MQLSIAIAALLATIATAKDFDTLSVQDKQTLSDELQAWKSSPAGKTAQAQGLINDASLQSDDNDHLKRFYQSKQVIQSISKANPEAKFGLTQFALMTESDFAHYVKRSFNRSKASLAGTLDAIEAESPALRAPAASSVDWTTSGCVAGVKNQGNCGSCWAFSAVASIESAYCMRNGNLVEFSEQQLTSCASSAGDGCNGGDETQAMQWVKSKGFICTEEEYQYTSGDSGDNGECSDDSCSGVQLSMSVVRVAKGETSLKTALSKRPITVAVTAGNSVWQHYTGGVISSCGSTSAQLDHAVFAVGFDSSSFKIKNSWGTSWGENGYIRIKSGKSDSSSVGLCQLAADTSYAQM